MAFIIESLIKRPGGSRVTLGHITYHFAPSPTDDRHTAVVVDIGHMQTLVAIKEGYRAVGIVPANAVPVEPAAPGIAIAAAPLGIMPGVDPLLSVSVQGSDADPVAITARIAAEDAADEQRRAAELAIRQGSPAPIVAQAPLPEDAITETAPVPEQLPGQAVNDGLDGLPREQLVAIFEAELQRKPSPRSKDETIIAQIVQGRRERATAP